MLEARYRHHLDRYMVEPFLPYLKRVLTPDQLTGLSLIWGLIAASAVALKWPTLATAALLLSGFADMLDGALARHIQRTGPFGCCLDIVTDRIVEGTIILGFFAANSQNAWACLLMLFSTLLCVTSFLVVGLFIPNSSEKSFHYSSGLIERFEAFVFFIVMVWLPQEFNVLAVTYIVLVLWTTGYRLFQARQILRM